MSGHRHPTNRSTPGFVSSHHHHHTRAVDIDLYDRDISQEEIETKLAASAGAFKVRAMLYGCARGMD